jgi:hypothetical protein
MRYFWLLWPCMYVKILLLVSNDLYVWLTKKYYQPGITEYESKLTHK